MRARRIAFLVPFCLAAASLAACGGGGGGGAALPPVQAPAAGNGGGAGSPSAPASVVISIAIPPASAASAHGRAPRYVSAGTKSASVSYAGTTQTTNCGATCALTAAVMPGPVTFSVSLYDGPNGSGHVLSSGQTTTTVVAGTSNSVKVTFGAVVAAVVVSIPSASVSAGTPATIPVTVTAKDAAGYTIVGSDPYATPIALDTDDGSGAFALSTSSVAAPSTPVTLAYDGKPVAAPIHLAAAVPGSQAAITPATIVVQAPSSPTPAPPSGSVPAHVKTYYFYGINGVNAGIPPAWMAAHADYAEDDAANDTSLLKAFKAAGGKYAVSYSDPAFSVYCAPPFTPPAGACRGPMGSLVSGDESAWLHGADGARVHKFYSDHFQYQEAMNPASASVQSAYRSSTGGWVSAMPNLDYVFADDSGGSLTGGDGTQLSGLLYNFNAPSVEIANDDAFIAAEKQVLAASARPVFVNGATPYTMMPSYDGAFLKAPNVAGQNFEGCYGDYNGLIVDDASKGPRWSNISNALIAVNRYGSTALCMNVWSATPSNRLYYVASWWMAYDPDHSVIVPQAPTSDGYTVLPEYDIVPTQPRATATTTIASLRAASGAYVREFAACYQAGSPIGPCAAVVNPGPSAVALPALAGRYTTALALDDRSSYTGGKAAWSGTVPASLGAYSAVVLR
jgi:hypothetical protein